MEYRKSYPTDAYLLIQLKNDVWKDTYYDVLPNGILKYMKENKEEIINYSALIYKLLLNHFDRRFDKEDIIKDSTIIFTKESVRTAKEKVAEEKIINATEYYIKY